MSHYMIQDKRSKALLKGLLPIKPERVMIWWIRIWWSRKWCIPHTEETMTEHLTYQHLKAMHRYMMGTLSNLQCPYIILTQASLRQTNGKKQVQTLTNLLEAKRNYLSLWTMTLTNANSIMQSMVYLSYSKMVLQVRTSREDPLSRPGLKVLTRFKKS